MNKTIWKYQLAITETQEIEMPVDAGILTAQMQAGTLCLWAFVSPDAPKERRQFEVLGTGNPIPDGSCNYIASVQQGQFVWHVFEGKGRGEP